MLRVVVPAIRASSSMRYSPDASMPCGCKVASNNCETADSTTSREPVRICRSARRTPPRIVEIAPAGCRGCLLPDMSSRRRDRWCGGARPRLIVGEPEIPHLTKILRGEAWVHRGVEAVLGQIPATAARHPCRLGQPLLQALVVTALHVLSDVEIAQAVPQDHGDTPHGVVDLPLHIDQKRVVARPGVRSGHEEQIRVAVC